MILAHKTIWVFDLDNTLYPANNNLFEQVDVKMGSFIASALNVDAVEARRIQKKYLVEYGTSLAGLMHNHNVNPDDFLDYVHDIDYSPVAKNDRLKKAVQGLKGKKYIHTNGTVKHAENVLDKLGMADDFDGIFDVVAGDLVPKPNKKPYDMLIEEFNINPNDSVFVEDMARNLTVPKQMGFTTVLVETDCQYAGMDKQDAMIDYSVSVLEEFLETI